VPNSQTELERRELAVDRVEDLVEPFLRTPGDDESSPHDLVLDARPEQLLNALYDAGLLNLRHRPRTRTLTAFTAELINTVRSAYYDRMVCDRVEAEDHIIAILGPGLWRPAADELLTRDEQAQEGDVVQLTDRGATVTRPYEGGASSA
jgi:hypothetical protein